MKLPTNEMLETDKLRKEKNANSSKASYFRLFLAFAFHLLQTCSILRLVTHLYRPSYVTKLQQSKKGFCGLEPRLGKCYQTDKVCSCKKKIACA